MSRRINGSLTSFEVTGSAREDQAATVGARALATQRNERDVYKVRLRCRDQFILMENGIRPVLSCTLVLSDDVPDYVPPPVAGLARGAGLFIALSLAVRICVLDLR